MEEQDLRMLFTDFDQVRDAEYIGMQKRHRIFDAVIDMRFRSEVHDRIDLVLGYELHYKFAIGNITLDESDVIRNRIQIMTIRGVGQFIEHDDRIVGETLDMSKHEM